MGQSVSITVCVRDGEHWIDDCMHSLISQDYGDFEIVAVDDGSSDLSLERLKKFEDLSGEKHGVKIKILSQPPLGLSAGRQLAVENSDGDWIAITDIDVRPQIDWITNLIKCSEDNEQENVGAVTGRTIFETTPDVVSKLRSIEIQQKYRNRPLKTNLANGPCSMFLRKALEKAGGFNPSWYHAEDMELSLNIISQGFSIIYNPEAVVRHVPEEGLATFLRKRKRDSRAHTRIVRNWPKSKRKGTSFDFIGVSGAVLMIIPTLLLYLIGILVLAFLDFQLDIDSSLLVLSPAIALNFGYVYLTSFRKLVRMLTKDAGLMNYPKIKFVLFSWSLALWIGLFLGFTDLITGRKGHKLLFSK